ncbi:MAG: hypothetical protein MUC67_06715 [Acidobacteria bacterium]|nr:hypothetical protein [Acidobacteriota bacterium]
MRFQGQRRLRVGRDGKPVLTLRDRLGLLAPVSPVYDPTVTPSSPNPVQALSIHCTATSLVVRWGLAQNTGVSQRLFFRSGDGQTTVLLTPVALPSSVVSYTLASQALSVPCGSV